jgi:hypothetical protein
MRNLVAMKPKQLLKHMSAVDYAAHCGLLTSPRNAHRPDEALALGAVWAADNDCFVSYEPIRIERWLKRWQPVSGTCQFFNCPDVIRDAGGTLERFDHWQPIIKALGWKVAFTVQNGMADYEVPWQRIDALFIGSTNDWKYSPYMFGVVAEAKRRGLWCHNGRVNTVSAITLSRAMGCDSFDGTGYVIEAAKAARHLPTHKQPIYQMLLL